MFGIGPGGLASDMEVFEVLDNAYRAERMMESIDTIVKLWTNDPPYKIDGKHWKISLANNVIPELGVGYVPKPYQLPHPPIVSTAMSPYSDSVKTAAIKGWGPMSANFCPEYVIASHWKKYCEGCEIAKRPATGDDWRVARNIVVAESDAEARDRVMDLEGSNYYYFDYLWKVLKSVDYTAVMKSDPKAPDDSISVEQLIDSMVVYGSPRTVLDKLVAFRERTGPFGGLLMTMMDGGGISRAREWESMTRLATEVMPKLSEATARGGQPSGARSSAKVPA
jgi:alkanesulfonate monooxygenase SsuD/methylene tetrahydromethanopterin reductase-like flavin-dependent oxidoreductase (luciferase family)